MLFKTGLKNIVRPMLVHLCSRKPSNIICRTAVMCMAQLDATTAFDRIDFCKLFREVIKKIPPLVIRLIMEMYKKQSMAERWNNQYSDSFGLSNVVKQGSVLSPILFCIDNLLLSLKKNDIGCHVGSHFFVGIWVRGRHHAFKSKCKRPTT